MSKCMVEGCENKAIASPLPIKLCAEHNGVPLRNSWGEKWPGTAALDPDEVFTAMAAGYSVPTVEERPIIGDRFGGDPKPHTIFFFGNGGTAVCDQYGQQMPKYQVGGHLDTVKALRADGIEWTTLGDVYGSPRNDNPMAPTGCVCPKCGRVH